MRVLSPQRRTYLRAGAGALAGTMLVRGAQRTAWGAAVGLVAALVELHVVLSEHGPRSVREGKGWI